LVSARQFLGLLSGFFGFAIEGLQKQKKAGAKSASPWSPLAICFKWLQADRPNHH
jgi:hypothetical protein